MKVLTIHNGSSARFYRLIPQLKYLKQLGHLVVLEPHSTPHLLKTIDWADIVIFQLVFSQLLVEHAKLKGKRIIFECDDLIHTVPKTHYAYPETKGLSRFKWLWRIWRLLRLCDGLIVTNENLKRVYGPFAKKTLVFPNWVDLIHWLKEYKHVKTSKIRLLWAGSTSHTGDLQMIRPVLKTILEKHPEVQFIYIGTGGVKALNKRAEFIYGGDLFAGLPDNREALLPVPANVWPYILATLNADLAIAPLEKNYFNKFKTQCKYFEYSINKIPAVYSRWFYTDVKEEETGLTAETDKEWVNQIERLIKDEFLRKRIGENAFEDVLANYIIEPELKLWAQFVLGKEKVDERIIAPNAGSVQDGN